jgi:hypothetical protein
MINHSTKIGITLILFIFIGCSPAIHLATPSGRPQVAVHEASWKTVSIAIADYNLSKGRKLDQVRPDEIVLYEATPSSDGSEQVTSKTIYNLFVFQDSIVIFSHRFVTADLDDENSEEANDQATYDAEQQELASIADRITTTGSQRIAEPIETR